MRLLFCLLLSLFFAPEVFSQWSPRFDLYFSSERVELAKGVYWTRITYPKLYKKKQIVNVVEVDLKQAILEPIDIKGCRKISVEAPKKKALAAINGTFFNSRCQSRNLIKMEGELKSYNEIRKQGAPALLISKSGEATIKIVKPSENPTEAWFAMGGFPQLVNKGKINLFPNENTSFFKSRHPRTAVGIVNKNKIFLVTVDGRSSKSAGLSLLDLAQLMVDFGAQQAMNLDGGGSTTLWVAPEGIANQPSDGSGERAVADALAVY